MFFSSFKRAACTAAAGALLALSSFAAPASAATVVVAGSPDPVTSGSNVTFTVSGDLTDVAAYAGFFTYDPAFLQFVSETPPGDFPIGLAADPEGDGSGAFIYTRADNFSGAGTPILSLTFKALAVGTGTLSVDGEFYSDAAAITPFTGTGSVAIAAGSGIPEPGTWALMIVGFGIAGAALRAKRRPIEAFA